MSGEEHLHKWIAYADWHWGLPEWWQVCSVCGKERKMP